MKLLDDLSHAIDKKFGGADEGGFRVLSDVVCEGEGAKPHSWANYLVAVFVEFFCSWIDCSDDRRGVFASDEPCEGHLLVFEELLVEGGEDTSGPYVVVFGRVDEG